MPNFNRIYYNSFEPTRDWVASPASQSSASNFAVSSNELASLRSVGWAIGREQQDLLQAELWL